MYIRYGKRIVIVKYYNVLFYMLFRVGMDNPKVDCLIQMVDECNRFADENNIWLVPETTCTVKNEV